MRAQGQLDPATLQRLVDFSAAAFLAIVDDHGTVVLYRVSRFALMETGGEDGEDKKKLESFYASMDDAEYDVVAQVKMQSASEELSKRMFADEREQIMKSFEADFLHDENLAKGC